MRTKMYTVYDTIARMTIGPIFTEQHHAAAIRIFTDAIRDPNGHLNKHPHDYQLRHIGDMDNSSGEIVATTNNSTESIIITGDDITNMEKQND